MNTHEKCIKYYFVTPLKLSSHHGDELSRSTTSPAINLVGPMKGLSSNAHHRR